MPETPESILEGKRRPFTGAEFLQSLRDGREVYIYGERVKDVTKHPAFKLIVDVRARIYDMAHEARYRDVMSYVDETTNEPNCVGHKLPRVQNDWHAKRAAADAGVEVAVVVHHGTRQRRGRLGPALGERHRLRPRRGRCAGRATAPS